MMELMLVVLLSSLSVEGVTGESDVIGSHEPIEVAVGDDAILPCHLEPPFDVTTLTVEWKRSGTDVHTYRSRKDYLIDQDKNFKGRTSLFHDEMDKGNISLKLTNVTELDAGSYTCFVPKLHSQVRRGYINLTVAEPVKKSNKGNQTNPNTEPEEHRHDRNTGIGIGIGIGIVIIIGIVIAVLWKKCRKTRRDRRGRQNTEGSQENNQETMSLNNMGNDNDAT